MPEEIPPPVASVPPQLPLADSSTKPSRKMLYGVGAFVVICACLGCCCFSWLRNPVVRPSPVASADTDERILISHLKIAMKEDRPTSLIQARMLPSIMHFGISEQYVLTTIGSPYSESRDGTGVHNYIWCANGIAMFATFENGSCTTYTILDEQDVEAMVNKAK